MQLRQKNQYFYELKKYLNDNFKGDQARKAYLKNFQNWPSVKDENWRLSRLGELARKKIVPTSASSGKKIICEDVLDGCCKLIFDNGVYRQDLSETLPECIEINILKINELENFFKSIDNFDFRSHPTLNISGSCSKHIVKIKIKKNSIINKPIQIFQTGKNQNSSIHPLIFYEIEDNASVKFLEVFKTASGLITPLEIFKINTNSKLDFVKVFEDGINTHNLSLSIKILEEGASCNVFSLLKGGNFTRFETHAFLHGEKSNINFSGIYLTSKKNHHDFTSVIYHKVPNSNSSQHVRGVLTDRSTGVFQGKVIVDKKAQKTNAQQMSKAILLSNLANSNSKPELEIYADDVICSHGATIGELDQDQIFYLLSRGISREKAISILTRAFLSEVIKENVDEVFFPIIDSKTIIELNKMLDNNNE